MEYMKYEIRDMKTRLEIGLGKIDKATCSAGSKVEQMENMVKIVKINFSNAVELQYS